MSTLRIMSWNVNGLRALYKKGFLDWLRNETPDVLCLQETKASEEQLSTDLKEVDGYHAYFSSAEKKGYSGVAIYSKREPLTISKGIGIDEFDREGRFIIADYGTFTLFNVYFPNGRASAERLTYKMRFYEAFLEHLGEKRNAGMNLVICGDVNTAHSNIDLARPEENSMVSGFLPIERSWIDKFISHGYVDTFRMFNQESGHYTWWDMITRARDRNVGWRIDYFFVNRALKDRVQSAYILPDVMGSDHCPIEVNISTED